MGVGVFTSSRYQKYKRVQVVQRQRQQLITRINGTKHSIVVKSGPTQEQKTKKKNSKTTIFL
jgi:hypothetical protein